MRFARRASTARPVSIMSSAAAGPTSRGRRLHAAPARHDAEHHFGQREARPRLVDRDAVAAGERELQAAAHAEAVDQRERREGQRGELVERVPAALHDRERVLRRLESA